MDVEASDISDDGPPPQSDDPGSKIPPKLLTKLLHHHFEHDKTRIGKDANALLGKYMETFVREALARAAYERSKAEGGAAGRDFLEVREAKAVPGFPHRRAIGLQRHGLGDRLRISRSWHHSYFWTFRQLPWRSRCTHA